MKRGKTYEWIPLWVEKWLWGSTRIELNPAERSVWVDLMVLGSKDDGYIRANPETPYQDQQLAGMLCIEVELLQSTVAKCIQYGKLEKDKYGCLRIVNWEAYSLGERYKRKLMADESAPKGRIRGPSSMYKSISKSIVFKGKEWEGISNDDMKSWAEAYPACDLKIELAKMREWLIANPTKAVKSNWRRFIINWLSRSQDRGGSTPSNKPEHRVSQIGASAKKDHGPEYWAKVRELRAQGLEGEALTDALAEYEKSKKKETS